MLDGVIGEPVRILARRRACAITLPLRASIVSTSCASVAEAKTRPSLRHGDHPVDAGRRDRP